MKKLLVILLMTMQPQIAAAAVDPTIRNGTIGEALPMSVSYSRSSEDKALFGLAITAKEQNKDRNGLDITTAMIMNCKTEHSPLPFILRWKRRHKHRSLLQDLFASCTNSTGHILFGGNTISLIAFRSVIRILLIASDASQVTM